MGIFGSIKKWFHKAGHEISHGASHAWHDINKGIHNISHDANKGAHGFWNWGTKAFNEVKKDTGTVYKEAKKDVGAVYKAAKPVVNQVYKDAKSVPHFFGQQISKVTSAGAGLVGHVGNAVEDVGQGIKGVGTGIGNFMPYLAIGAVGVAAVYMYSSSSSRKRSASQMSRKTYPIGNSSYYNRPSKRQALLPFDDEMAQ